MLFRGASQAKGKELVIFYFSQIPDGVSVVMAGSRTGNKQHGRASTFRAFQHSEHPLCCANVTNARRSVR